MFGIRWRTDGDDRLRLRYLGRRGENRRPTEAVADEERRRVVAIAQEAAAAIRSRTFEEKVVLAKSPPEAPRPVKSKRKTPMPRLASSAEMREAANTSFEQVKQWANSAKGLHLTGG